MADILTPLLTATMYNLQDNISINYAKRLPLHQPYNLSASTLLSSCLPVWNDFSSLPCTLLYAVSKYVYQAHFNMQMD